MLLRDMISDEEGRLTGTLEDGKFVTLSCPHPHALDAFFLGGERYLKSNLIEHARKDNEHYYLIGEIEHAWKGDVLPYITFEK